MTLDTWPPASPVPALAVDAGPRAARSSAWLLAESALRLAATALVSFWIARRLGPEGYGVLNLASALAVVFGVLATLGLDLPVVVRLARGQPAAGLLSDLLLLRGVAALVATLLAAALACALLAGDPAALAVALVALLSVLAGVPALVDLAFKAAVDAGPPARARVLAGVAGALARIAVVSGGGGLVALAAVLVAETALGSALLWHGWQARGGVLPRWRLADAARARRLLRDGLPFLGLSVATLVYMKGDLILLGHLSDARQVGLYAACQKLSEVLYIVPAVLADSAYPLLARQAGSAGSAGAGLPGQLLFDLACGSAMLCVVAALLLAPWFIVAVFGSRYEPAVGLFQWHALTALPVALELARSRWLASNERPALAWLGATLGAASSLVVNLWAMPYFGAVGAVAAAMLAFSLMAWLPVLAVPALRPALALQVRALWPWARLWSAGRLWATTRRMAA